MEITINFRKKGKWSRNADRCQGCKTKKVKHFAKDLCQTCYNRTYQLASKKRKKLMEDQEVKKIPDDLKKLFFGILDIKKELSEKLEESPIYKEIHEKLDKLIKQEGE